MIGAYISKIINFIINKEETLEMFAWCFAVVMVLSDVTIGLAYTSTGSMSPTIPAEGYVLNEQISYNIVNPQRFDVITFLSNQTSNVVLMKRIVGMPGDIIESREGHVYINNERLNEYYLEDGVTTSDFGPYTIPEDYYFVMGDNRTNSCDSRHWKDKFIHKDNIVSHVIIGINPKIRLIK